MKARNLSLVLVVVMVGSLVGMAFVPVAPALQDGEPGLTEAQLVLIGLAASVLTWLLRLIVQQGYNPKKEHVAIGLYVVSFVLAIAFTPLTFPAFPACTDAPTCVSAFVQWIGLLLTLASPVAGVAYLIYNVLLKRVLDKAFPPLR